MRSFLVWFVLGLMAAAMGCSTAQDEFKLSSGGRPLAAIVVDPDATIPEKTAANELSAYLKKVTKADLRVYAAGTEPTDVSRILIGQSAETKKLLGIADWKGLKFDGIAIKFVGKDLVLAGDRPRGSLYAVYTFLEDYVGCKWWTAQASHIPNKPNLSVKRIDQIHTSPFLCRETYYRQVLRQNQEFSARLKLNGHHQTIPDEFGGHYTLIGFVHTMNRLLPPSVYFKEHPEWYALVNGKRTSETQLCLTNEEMKKELTKQALKWIEADPTAGMISISQNDTSGYCQCARCEAIAKAEGSESGPLIKFVNSVAEEIQRKYPDFLVETLAYQYTQKAPKNIRPNANVLIRLCSISCDFSTPFTSKTNTSFDQDLQDWKRISKRLYVWDYVVNFGNLLVPHPNWRVLAPNIRILAANNVVGLFEQGDGFNNDSAFENMKIWVLSHLMWNPNLDQRKLMKEFAAGYYGPAAPPLIQYLDLTSDSVEKSKTYLGCFIGDNIPFMDQQTMSKANDLFDKAEQSVKKNPTLLKRVKLERLALDHAWIIGTTLDRSKAGKARGLDMKALCEDYISRSQASGNDYRGEATKIDPDGYANLRRLAAIPAIPHSRRIPTRPNAAKGLKTADWVDIQEDKFNLHNPHELLFDAAASNLIAISMPGSSKAWAVQASLCDEKLPVNKKASVYVTVKVKKKAASGPAFTIGIYDTVNRKSIITRSVAIEDIKSDGYVDYRLGSFIPDSHSYIYVAPPGSADLVKNILVDRIFFVKQK